MPTKIMTTTVKTLTKDTSASKIHGKKGAGGALAKNQLIENTSKMEQIIAMDNAYENGSDNIGAIDDDERVQRILQ